MSRIRFRILFILLVLILLVVSTLFGLLTYWLDAQVLPAATPGRGSMQPPEYHIISANRPEQFRWGLLRSAPAPPAGQEVKTCNG
jgi:hypothetical protein